MYPVVRMFWQLWKHRNDPKLGFTDEHVSSHLCLPWDIDIWLELNNGRTLTLYDLGRIPLGQRTGLVPVLKKKGWGLTVAGSTVRYRRRITAFQRITMRSRGIGYDDRFFYVEQSMWRPDGECAGHVLIRSAVTSKKGIVPPAQVMEAMGATGEAPELPEWVKAWIAGDAQRPWPPMQD